MHVSSFQQPLFTAPEVPNANEAAKPNSSDKPGLTARVWSTVKNVLSTLLYYFSCCMIDLRAKVVMFEGQKNVHVLKALPQTAQETSQLRTEVREAMEAAMKVSHPTMSLSDNPKFFHARLTDEVVHTLTTALKSGISPVEYKFTHQPTSKNGLKLTIYAPSCMKQSKLPALDKRLDAEYNDSFVVEVKWKESEVKVAANTSTKETDSKAKVKSITCFSQVFGINNLGFDETVSKKQERAKEIESVALSAQLKLLEANAAKMAPLKIKQQELEARVAAGDTDAELTALAKQVEDLEAQISIERGVAE